MENSEDKNSLSKKRVIMFAPAIAAYIGVIICCIVYTAIYSEREAVDYIQMFGFGIIPFLFPLYSVIAKKPMPVVYTSLAGVMVILSLIGTVFDVYYSVPWWDTFLHGSFGTIAAAFVYKLTYDWQGEKMNNVWRFFVIFFFVMGIGAMWEICEYAYDTLCGGDAQKVQFCIEQGVSPVTDTMEDLIITVVGIFVFYAALLCKYLICKRLKGGTPEE